MARKPKWTKTSAQQLVLSSHPIRREICRSGDYRNNEKVAIDFCLLMYVVVHEPIHENCTWYILTGYLLVEYVDTYRPQKLMIDKYSPSGGQGQDDIIAMFQFPFRPRPILSSSRTQLSLIHMNDSISLIRKILIESRKKMELL